MLVRKPKSGWSSPVIASTVIASAALGLAIYNAHLDRQYRELSIKPVLFWEVEANDFHVAILNNGVGPAQIKRIATKFSGGCTVFDDSNGRDLKVFESTTRNIANYFADPLNELVQKSVWEPTSPKLYARALTPGQIMAPREKMILFELQPKQLEAVTQKFETLDTDSQNKIVRRFLERAHTLPYYIEYCSLTGDYCGGAEDIQTACSH
jgi:hypothetical protein